MTSYWGLLAACLACEAGYYYTVSLHRWILLWLSAKWPFPDHRCLRFPCKRLESLVGHASVLVPVNHLTVTSYKVHHCEWTLCNKILAWRTFLRLPECKGRTYEELNVMFHEKVPARKFAEWQGDAYDNEMTRRERKGDKEKEERMQKRKQLKKLMQERTKRRGRRLLSLGMIALAIPASFFSPCFTFFLFALCSSVSFFYYCCFVLSLLYLDLNLDWSKNHAIPILK